MSTIYKEWLRRAYLDDDPRKFLLRFVDKQDIKVSMVNRFISDIKTTAAIEQKDHPQRHLADDLAAFYAQVDYQKPSIYILRCSFCFFATAMTHIWMDNNDKPIKEQSILAYVCPNEPLPYIWLNINEQSDLMIEMVKHTLDVNEYNPLDIIVHTHTGPRNPLATVKLSIDITTGEIVSALNGQFMQLVVRLDEHRAYVKNPCKGQQFVIVLTYEDVIHGVYYNDGEKNRIDPCIYCCHY